MDKRASIQIENRTYKRFKSLKLEGETFDDLVNRIMLENKEIDMEKMNVLELHGLIKLMMKRVEDKLRCQTNKNQKLL